ncbi:MAG: HpcH/HpaI aldolase/citrate lyase family protein [Alphaproteobacteria bacterium]|jgi:citrate lyase subunit beta/citryl-CoA lyase
MTMGKREMPVWRSLLYVPVNVDRYVDKAHLRGADGIILDLEDSVTPSEKDNARTMIGAAAEKVSRNGADVLVRINRPLEIAVRDIEAAVSPQVMGLKLPKVQSAEHVQLMAELVSEMEVHQGMEVGSTWLLPMVETADAFFQLDKIAKAHPRNFTVLLGGEDFALDVGFNPDPECYLYPKQQSLIAARAAGITPMGLIGTVADYSDPEAYLGVVRHSAKFGFEGASCIHPANVQPLNEGFSPKKEEVDYARKVIEADAEAAAAGRGSFELDGKMIDIPVVVRAQRLLARADKIAAREARGAAASA